MNADGPTSVKLMIRFGTEIVISIFVQNRGAYSEQAHMNVEERPIVFVWSLVAVIGVVMIVLGLVSLVMKQILLAG